LVEGIPSAVLIYGIVTFCSIKRSFVQNDILVFEMLIDIEGAGNETAKAAKRSGYEGFRWLDAGRFSRI
jgi:hypothetical protein